MHDIVSDSLNTSYDLILSRQTTQHLKTADVLKVVQNFITSGSKYLLTSNYPEIKVRENTKKKQLRKFKNLVDKMYTLRTTFIYRIVI